jgi:hypothetical protein
MPVVALGFTVLIANDGCRIREGNPPATIFYDRLLACCNDWLLQGTVSEIKK